MQVDVTEIPSFEGQVIGCEASLKHPGAGYLRFMGPKGVFSVYLPSGFTLLSEGQRVQLKVTCGRYGLIAESVSAASGAVA
jgi:hypothetical protein